MVQLQGQEGEDGGGGEGGGAGEQAWRGGVEGVARGSQGAAAHPGAVEAAGAHAGAEGARARARRRAARGGGARRPGPSTSATFMQFKSSAHYYIFNNPVFSKTTLRRS